MAKKEAPAPVDYTGDEFHGIGGSYEIRNGKRVRVEEPTAPPRAESETPAQAEPASVGADGQS